MRITTPQRYELKYIIRREQQQEILADLLPYVVPDGHGDELGSYTITSLYYDTADFKAYWDKIEGHRFRRKVRLRVYGAGPVTPETACFVEIKQRLNNMVQKKRTLLPYAQATDMDTYDALDNEHGINPTGTTEDPAKQAVLQEVQYLYQQLHLQPACIVRYNRIAFNGRDANPDLRITFDTELRSRVHDLSLLSTGFADNSYFLPPLWAIMEIKVNRTAPYWLAQVLRAHGVTAHRFSKYCTGLEHCHGQNLRQHIAVA